MAIYLQAWSSTCPYPGTNSNGVTYNGSALRANWSGADFCLVELNNTPQLIQEFIMQVGTGIQVGLHKQQLFIIQLEML
ncbi:MAG: hypothetical protein WKG06_19300 [Segetibacter sp.]